MQCVFRACLKNFRVLVIAMQKKFPLNFCRAFILGGTLAVSATVMAQDAPKPIKALLITGGCCHDYANQRFILKAGIEARANVIVDIIYSADSNTHPALPIYGHPDYAKDYDVVIHDECAADINDTNIIQGVLKPHQDGIPGVNLHCAMHCYRFGDFTKPLSADAPNAHWYEYLGLQSSGHGPQEPIAISFTDKTNAVTTGFADWTTIHEEHYNNVKIWDTAHPLAHGTQVIKNKAGEPQRTNDFVVAWENIYQGKTRVFSTTIGHNNETVADARYLDLVTRGLLWACDKLDADGKPKAGYGK
jgi:type 1 glutamine amidotransferase